MKRGRTPAAKDWAAELKRLKMIWRAERPEDRIGMAGASSRGKDCYFTATDGIDEGVEFRVQLSAWQTGDATWSIRARGALYDFRVAALRDFADDHGPSKLQFLDFDVLAAHCALAGEPLLASPSIDLSASDDLVTSVVQSFVKRIDVVWACFGPRNRQSFESLALAMMGMGEIAGCHVNEMGGIFAAFIYGRRELAHRLLAAAETRWNELSQSEPDDPARGTALFALNQFARARFLLEQGTRSKDRN